MIASKVMVRVISTEINPIQNVSVLGSQHHQVQVRGPNPQRGPQGPLHEGRVGGTFYSNKDFWPMKGIFMIDMSDDLPNISLSHKMSMAKATENGELQIREQPLIFANDDHYQVILELIEKHPEFKAGKV